MTSIPFYTSYSIAGQLPFGTASWSTLPYSLGFRSTPSSLATLISPHGLRLLRCSPPLDFPLSNHQFFLLTTDFNSAQTLGDSWFKPTEENISAGVCLRVEPGQFRVFPYENPYLAPFEAAVRILNPLVAVKVRTAAVHSALATV